DFEAMGKGVGTDAARGKATFPALYGVEESRRLAVCAVDQAKGALDGSPLEDDPVLTGIADFILLRRK
ncbi:MAG: polyprenyl synthetase family protein, partial [Gemmatimonadota bacterium]|nr:polyprenyl synthetase family protein [Gemmatimonadota bacterium]